MNTKSLEWGAPIVAMISIMLVIGELIGKSAGDHLKIATYLAIAIVALLAPKIASISISKDGITTELKAQIEENGADIKKTKHATLEMDELVEQHLTQIYNEIKELRDRSSSANTGVESNVTTRNKLPAITYANDPQKERFGGQEARDGLRISATARPSDTKGDWQKITLIVKSENKAQPLTDSKAQPLTASVDFYLHDTFRPNHFQVPVQNGEAKLVVRAYGAFTVGALAGPGKVPLELDLAQYRGFTVPDEWRVR